MRLRPQCSDGRVGGGRLGRPVSRLLDLDLGLAVHPSILGAVFCSRHRERLPSGRGGGFWVPDIETLPHYLIPAYPIRFFSAEYEERERAGVRHEPVTGHGSRLAPASATTTTRSSLRLLPSSGSLAVRAGALAQPTRGKDARTHVLRSAPCPPSTSECGGQGNGLEVT
ncbi:hypothetical protein RRG08_036084 [Elysia crispata]|uniref:Uncharacterized protein n=1 Tax=Elysia crispata TaxID=231223 RepID=A0AAE1AMA5_9GAST|nr:hypothetical protein RRG08_036084 [Elysia crispata]